MQRHADKPVPHHYRITERPLSYLLESRQISFADQEHSMLAAFMKQVTNQRRSVLHSVQFISSNFTLNDKCSSWCLLKLIEELGGTAGSTAASVAGSEEYWCRNAEHPSCYQVRKMMPRPLSHLAMGRSETRYCDTERWHTSCDGTPAWHCQTGSNHCNSLACTFWSSGYRYLA